MPKGGQIVDASLVNAPKNRNSRDENKQIKEGKPPSQIREARRKAANKAIKLGR